ncbi:MAG: carbohydrate ABC transporter permease [Aggregatilineales bacterium]
MSMFKRFRQIALLEQTILTILAFLTLYPLFFMVSSSFKTNDQFITNFWGLSWPLNLENYIDVFPAVSGFIVNSIIYTVLTVSIVAVLALFTGYAFARFRFAGKEFLFLAMLALMMLPGVLTLAPLFVQMRDWGWLNTRQGVVLPWVATQLVFATFIMRIFFEKLPKEVFEAARLDGASELRLLWSVAIPMALPGLGTIVIIDSLFSWNNIIWPLVVVFDRDKLPIAPGMIGFRGDYYTDFGLLFAGYTLASLPLIILFIFMIRKFIKGLEGGLSV